MIVNVSKKILLFWILQLQFIDTVIERQPKLRRQRCIFTKERGTDEQPMNRRRFHLLFLYMLFWNSSHTFLLLADISMYLFFSSSQGRTFSERHRWTWIFPHGVIWWWASCLATAPSARSAHPSLRAPTSWPTTPHVQLRRSLKPPLHCQSQEWSKHLNLTLHSVRQYLLECSGGRSIQNLT